MVEEISSRGEDTKKTGNAWLAVSITAFVLLLLAVGFTLWLVFRAQTNTDQGVLGNMKQTQSTTDFPLYAPKTLPPDFEMVEGSVSSGESFVSFSLRYQKDKQIVVTQQQRPTLMEEVSKVRKFRTSLGNAYIAELNGRNTGFIVAAKTLVIVSSTSQVNTEALEKLMRSIAAL